MVELQALWLPILLSAVFMFIASSIIHMAPLWHINDYPAVPNQDKVMDALRPFAIPPGDYMLPRCKTTSEMKTPEFTEKLKKGPVMVLTVMPNGEFKMGGQLISWFVYGIVVSIFAAYIAGRSLTAGAEYLEVFRYTGTVAFACYSVALAQMSIWYKRKWSTTIKTMFDGLIYALVTAGVFGWLWPR